MRPKADLEFYFLASILIEKRLIEVVKLCNMDLEDLKPIGASGSSNPQIIECKLYRPRGQHTQKPVPRRALWCCRAEADRSRYMSVRPPSQSRMRPTRPERKGHVGQMMREDVDKSNCYTVKM